MISFVAAGDSMIRDHLPHAPEFQKVRDFLKRGDIRFTNLEDTVGMLVWPVCTGFPDLTQQRSHEFCLSGNPGALVSACGSCQVPGWTSGLQV